METPGWPGCCFREKAAEKLAMATKGCCPRGALASWSHPGGAGPGAGRRPQFPARPQPRRACVPLTVLTLGPQESSTQLRAAC